MECDGQKSPPKNIYTIILISQAYNLYIWLNQPLHHLVKPSQAYGLPWTVFSRLALDSPDTAEIRCHGLRPHRPMLFHVDSSSQMNRANQKRYD